MVTISTRDEQGKWIIEDYTPNKKPGRFYRQKGGGICYEEMGGNRLTAGVLTALKVAKQENCSVNYNCCYGITPVNPEMRELDALNNLVCSVLIKETPPNESRTKIERTMIEKIKARRNAPECINFEDFYSFDSFKKIINFCEANDISPHALKLYYDAAVDYAESKGGSCEVARGVEHLGLPKVITKENLPELKKKLVLSRGDPRVVEAKKRVALQLPNGNDIKNR